MNYRNEALGMLVMILIQSAQMLPVVTEGAKESQEAKINEEKIQEERAKKEENLKREVQARQEEIVADLKTKASVEATLNNPTAPRAAKLAAQDTLTRVSQRISDNQQQVKNLTQEIDTLLRTPEVINQEALYQKAFEQKIGGTINEQQILSLARTEMNRIQGGRNSSIMTEVSYNDYNQQRQSLEQLIRTLDALNVSASTADAVAQLLQQMNDRLMQIDAFIPSQALSGNQLDAKLNLSQKITADRIRDLKIELTKVGSLPLNEQVRILRETQEVMHYYTITDDALQTLLTKKIDSLQLDKTPLAKQLGLGLQSLADQARLLEEYTWQRMSQEKTIPLADLQQIMDTAKAYGLDQQAGFKDFMDVIDQRITLEKEAAGTRNTEVVDDLTNAVQRTIEMGEIAKEQTSLILEAGTEKILEVATNVGERVIESAANAGRIAQEVGQNMVKLSDAPTTVANLVNLAADVTNKVQLIGIQAEPVLSVVQDFAPTVAKQVDQGLSSASVVEDLSTGIIGKAVNAVAPTLRNVLAKTGKLLINVGDVTAQVTDKLKQAQTLDRDMQIKEYILAKNDPQARIALMERVRQLVEGERALLARPKPSFFEKVRTIVNDYVHNVGAIFKKVESTAIQPKLDESQRNFQTLQTEYKRWLIDVTKSARPGMNPNALSPEQINELLQKAAANNDPAIQQKMTDYATRLSQAVTQMADSLQAYAGTASVAGQSMAFTVDAWDTLAMDKDASVLDMIHGIFALREQKIAYLQALKESIGQLRQESQAIGSKPIDSLNTAFIDQLAQLIDGRIVSTAVDNQQFVDTVIKNIDAGKRSLELQITQ